MARDKVKRAFVWIRQSMRITQRTTLPAEILSEIRPGLDTFGWDRRSPSPSGEGNGPQDENAQSNLATDTVLLSAVPAGIMRYVIYCSYSHNDAATRLALSLQVRVSGLDMAIDPPVITDENPIRVGSLKPILLEPGAILLARSFPAPGVASRIFIRYRFVDLDFGEYIRPL